MTLDVGQELEERFVRYARIDTQADESSATTPSTEKQFDLLNLLVEELREIGAQDVTLTDYGAVLATIPATVARDVADRRLPGPRRHVAGIQRHRRRADRPPQLRRRRHRPARTIRTQVLSPEQFPYLAQKVGDDIITASGTTLLGADDKAGVAIIMAMADHLLAPSRPRPRADAGLLHAG